jgi:O-antigen/teichoic acid export membrane protein
MTATANRSFEQSLSSVVRGTGVVLFGSLCGQALGLANNIVMRRGFSVYDFGLISLALSVVLFVQPLAELGLGSGLPRFIGFHRGRNEHGAVRGVVYTAVLLTAIAGGVFSLGIWLLADLVAAQMESPDLAPTLRVMAFVAAGLALCHVLLGVFRGWGQVQQKLLYDDLFPNVVRLLLLWGIVVLGGPITWVAAAYLLSTFAEVAVLLWTARRTVAVRLPPAPIDWSAGVQMMRFSLPLLGSNQLSVVGRQANLFLLGLFLSPADAAQYSTAALFAPSLQIFYGAVRFIFLPVSARLVGAEEFDEFNRLYATVSKWIAALSAPVAVLFMVLPGPLLVLLFGEQYRPAALALQVLTLGYFFSVWVGPNGGALTSLGHSGHVFWGFMLSNVLAIGLSFALIPTLGILGATIAAALSQVGSNLYMSWALYRLRGTLPFGRGHTITTLAMLGAVTLGLSVQDRLVALPVLVVAPVLGITLALVSLGSTFLLGGIDAADRQLWAQARASIRAKVGR